MAELPPLDLDNPADDRLTASVVRGLRWTYASTVLVAVIQIAVTAVLARLLTPAAFGLVAMAGVLLRFGQYFAQMGVGQALVQRPNLTVRDVHTAFTSAIVLGAGFTVLFIALAPLGVFLFPGSDQVVSVTRAMSLTFLLGGLTATAQGLLRRDFEFRVIALTEMLTYLAGYASVSLLLALAGAGVWSLVAGSLAQATLMACFYVLYCRRRLGFAFAGESLRNIYSYGGRISVIGFLEVISTTLDTLWAGRIFGPGPTGLYSRSRNLAIVPLYQFTTSLSRVLLPAYSRIQSEAGRLRASYVSGLTVMAALVFPTAWGVSGAAHEVVSTLLGEQWLEAIPLLVVMSLAVPFMLLMHLSALLCDAVAALRPRMVITVFRLAWLTALLATIGRRELLGVAIGFAITELLTYLAYQIVMRRLLDVARRQLWRAQSIGIASGAVSGAALYGLHVALSRLDVPAYSILAIQLTVGAVILLATATRARDGVVWNEVRARLSAAGVTLETGRVGGIVRLLDRMSRRPSETSPQSRPTS
jgi:O-antigen/teichoic acid export membrane protein